MSTIDLTYTGRERSFVTWSAILGYAFDFYNLIIMAFFLTQIQKSVGMTAGRKFAVIERKEHG